MQSSSLLPASSVRSFRVRAAQPGPPPMLVAAIVLLMLGAVAGVVAIDGTNQRWLGSVVSSGRSAIGWSAAPAVEDAFEASIAKPVRIPLDPVPFGESTPIAVAEASVVTPRRDAESGPPRPAAAETVDASRGVVLPDAAGTSAVPGADSSPPAASSAAAGPTPVADAPAAPSSADAVSTGAPTGPAEAATPAASSAAAPPTTGDPAPASPGAATGAVEGAPATASIAGATPVGTDSAAASPGAVNAAATPSATPQAAAAASERADAQ
jgi:hypothetical protein